MGKLSFILLPIIFVLASCGGKDSKDDPDPIKNAGSIEEAKALTADMRTVAGVAGVTSSDKIDSLLDKAELATQLFDGEGDDLLIAVPMVTEAFLLAADAYNESDGVISAYEHIYEDENSILVSISNENGSPIYKIDQAISISEGVSVDVNVSTEIELNADFSESLSGDIVTEGIDFDGNLNIKEGLVESSSAKLTINQGSLVIRGTFSEEYSTDENDGSNMQKYQIDSIKIDLETKIEEKIEGAETVSFVGKLALNIDDLYLYDSDKERSNLYSEKFDFEFDNIDIELAGEFSDSNGSKLEADIAINLEADGLKYGCTENYLTESIEDSNGSQGGFVISIFPEECKVEGSGSAKINFGIGFMIDVEGTDVDVALDMDIKYEEIFEEGTRVGKNKNIEIDVAYKDTSVNYDLDYDSREVVISNGSNVTATFLLGDTPDGTKLGEISDGETTFAEIISMDGDGTKIKYSDNTMEVY